MSTNFTVTRDQIISSALRKLGVIELGDTPDATTIQNASLVLNLLIKQMATTGLRLWTINEYVMPYIVNKTMYTIGGTPCDYYYNSLDPLKVPVTDKPLKVIQAFLRNTSVSPEVDIPMQLISKQEYNILGSKFSTGTTNTVFYDVRKTNGNMYVFLTPDQPTQQDYELHFVAQRQIEDINTAQSVPDFPSEWFNTLVWNLADQLAIEYSVPANQRAEIAQRAAGYMSEMNAWDVEVYSTFFQPDMRMANQGQRNPVL